MADTRAAAETAERGGAEDAQAVEALPPEQPGLPPSEWIRKNLFSSPFNSVLTVAFGLLALLIVRGLLNFTFSEERNWDAVRTNLRLIFTHAYPEEQYSRIWVCVGTIAVLAGLSIGLAAAETARRGVSVRKLSSSLVAMGATVALGVVLREPSALTDIEGRVRRDDSGILRESFAEAMTDRWAWWLAAAVLASAGAALWFGFGDERRRETYVRPVELFMVGSAVLVLSGWIYPWGHYAFADGEFIAEPGRTVAMSTKLPWTVIWLLLAAAIAAGRSMRRAGAGPNFTLALNLCWLACPFVLYWVVLRDPDLDWGRVLSVDIPLGVLFAALGGAVLWLLTDQRIGELGRIIATLLMGVAVLNWVAGFFGWYPMLQKVRLSFLLVALAALVAHNFAGERSKRLRLLAVWVALMAVFHYMATLMNSPSTVETPTEALIGGFSVTLIVASFTLLFSFPLGVMLALARTSRLPIFRVMSTSFIEVVRGVPLITILLFFAVMLQLFLPDGMSISLIAAATLGYTLFSAAYLAENVRGGLQSIRRGQYEASDAVGLTAMQRTLFIVLPQALRVSIPPLVGQVIATFKETSLLAVIGAFDLLRMANNVIPSQTQFLGVKREGLLFVCLVYWVFAYAMSKHSQRLEKRLGVGER
ncbi:MAG: amino acid ABC transporter permease [Acidimicrobiaceae bacterium]|nr:amino acid ABC transporter permease [Acidimicrobiaceae bacterium]MCY4280733.1 amino acid ABC transporter permease [Acidimicrobiaceae bacterium]MCY4295074.1 amino acid ABC transporter permease [Acidimicrobiaceae bacterium]